MIAYLKGTVADIKEEDLILDVHDIGYHVRITSETADRLAGVEGLVKIYTYTYIREDAFQLFGFLRQDDLDIFQKLITVNGIGPKGAMAILSVMSADALRLAVLAGDSKAISKAPGIGAKTAQRLILDLKDKVSIRDTFVHQEAAAYDAQELSGLNGVKNDAIAALTALGYSASEALGAVKKVELTADMDSEQLLRAALRHMLR